MTLAVAATVVQLWSGVCGSADEFQCACGYDAWRHTDAMRSSTEHHRDDASMAAYGLLVSRMLLVAHNRPEPTARWLWLLHLLANARRPADATESVNDAVDRVRSELRAYLAVCRGRRVATAAARWSRDEFEKYVLENVTATIVRLKADPAVTNVVADVTAFEPRRLYLNDGPDPTGLLAPDVGIDWGTAAVRLSRVYALARRQWVSGTRQLVLYHKELLSTVAATLMAYVLVHVRHCRRYREPSDGDKGLVGEYERAWMSVAGLLDAFKSYLDLGAEKYYRTLLQVANNPVRDDRAILVVERTITAHIVRIGAGRFGPQRPAVVPEPAGEPQISSLVELIALIDNNIGAAEKYLKTVQHSLSDVNFKIINDFMRSTHIWLT